MTRSLFLVLFLLCFGFPVHASDKCSWENWSGLFTVFGYSSVVSDTERKNIFVIPKRGDMELGMSCCKDELKRGERARTFECERIVEEIRQRYVYVKSNGSYPEWYLSDEISVPRTNDEAREFGFKFLPGSSRWLKRCLFCF